MENEIRVETRSQTLNQKKKDEQVRLMWFCTAETWTLIWFFKFKNSFLFFFSTVCINLWTFKIFSENFLTISEEWICCKNDQTKTTKTVQIGKTWSTMFLSFWTRNCWNHFKVWNKHIVTNFVSLFTDNSFQICY